MVSKSTSQLFSEIDSRISCDNYFYGILATNNSFTSALYRVINDKISYSNDTVEIFDEFLDKIQEDLTGTGVTILYKQNNEALNFKSFPKYNPELFDDDLFELLIFQEFGVKPKEEERVIILESSIKKEKIKNTLVYACYANNTQDILDRASVAKKSHVNKKLEYTGTPLGLCAENDNLLGFKAVADMGADIHKKSLGSSPLKIAFKYSMDIVNYVFENHREAFDKEFDKEGFYLAADCKDRMFLDLLKSVGGDLSKCDTSFPHLHNFTDRDNLVGINFCLDNGIDVNLKDKEKRTALNKAIMRGYDASSELLRSRGAIE